MLEFNIKLSYLEVYLLGINLFAFLIYLFDKVQALRANKNITRISEFNLLFISIVGGSIGSLLVMLLFRHKIKKASFIFKFIVAIIIQVTIVYYVKDFRF